MLRRVLPLALSLAFLAPAVPASADATVQIVLPQIRFSAQPRFVVVAPGVEVVPDYDYEVYRSGGFYWTFRDGHWFRARSWRHPRWVVVRAHTVPAHVRGLPRGHYVRWHPAERVRRDRPAGRPAVVRDRRDDRHDAVRERREERRDVVRDRRDDRRDAKKDRREERRDDRKDRRDDRKDRRENRGHR